MRTSTIISIEVVEDSWMAGEQGEIDFSIRTLRLEQYLSVYGEAGIAKIEQSFELVKERLRSYLPGGSVMPRI